MMTTPQRQAWLDGAGAGEMLVDMLRQGRTWAETMRAVEPADRPPELLTAWLSGFGQAVHDAAGCIPGHYLSGVVHPGPPLRVRTELVPDRHS